VNERVGTRGVNERVWARGCGRGLKAAAGAWRAVRQVKSSQVKAAGTWRAAATERTLFIASTCEYGV
jgi:hypothetical protein